MNLLVIDTAHWESSVALWKDGQEIAFQEKISEKDQAAHLPQLVKEVMGQQKVDHILVNIGPGSFTGIRVGVAFAKGLAMGLHVPLKGMDSFKATFASLKEKNDLADVLVIIDARRSDVFAQRFLKGIPQDPQSLTRENIETLLDTTSPPLFAGNGLHPFLDGLIYKEVPSSWRGAQKLAYAFFNAPSFVSEPLPFYVRDADVTLPRSC